MYVEDLEAESFRQYGNAVRCGFVGLILMDEEILRFVDNADLSVFVENWNLGADLPISECDHQRSEHVRGILKRVG